MEHFHTDPTEGRIVQDDEDEEVIVGPMPTMTQLCVIYYERNHGQRADGQWTHLQLLKKTLTAEELVHIVRKVPRAQQLIRCTGPAGFNWAQERYKCCGRRYGEMGCWSSTTSMIIPYDVAYQFRRNCWKDSQNPYNLWDANQPIAPSQWNLREEDYYANLDNKIKDLKAQLRTSIARALQQEKDDIQNLDLSVAVEVNPMKHLDFDTIYLLRQMMDYQRLYNHRLDECAHKELEDIFNVNAGNAHYKDPNNRTTLFEGRKISFKTLNTWDEALDEAKNIIRNDAYTKLIQRIINIKIPNWTQKLDARILPKFQDILGLTNKRLAVQNIAKLYNDPNHFLKAVRDGFRRAKSADPLVLRNFEAFIASFEKSVANSNVDDKSLVDFYEASRWKTWKKALEANKPGVSQLAKESPLVKDAPPDMKAEYVRLFKDAAETFGVVLSQITHLEEKFNVNLDKEWDEVFKATEQAVQRANGVLDLDKIARFKAANIDWSKVTLANDYTSEEKALLNIQKGDKDVIAERDRLRDVVKFRLMSPSVTPKPSFDRIKQLVNDYYQKLAEQDRTVTVPAFGKAIDQYKDRKSYDVLSKEFASLLEARRVELVRQILMRNDGFVPIEKERDIEGKLESIIAQLANSIPWDQPTIALPKLSAFAQNFARFLKWGTNPQILPLEDIGLVVSLDKAWIGTRLEWERGVAILMSLDEVAMQKFQQEHEQPTRIEDGVEYLITPKPLNIDLGAKIHESAFKWQNNSCWIDAPFTALFAYPQTALIQAIRKLHSIRVKGTTVNWRSKGPIAVTNCTKQGAQEIYDNVIQSINILYSKKKTDICPLRQSMVTYQDCLPEDMGFAKGNLINPMAQLASTVVTLRKALKLPLTVYPEDQLLRNQHNLEDVIVWDTVNETVTGNPFGKFPGYLLQSAVLQRSTEEHFVELVRDVNTDEWFAIDNDGPHVKQVTDKNDLIVLEQAGLHRVTAFPASYKYKVVLLIYFRNATNPIAAWTGETDASINSFVLQASNVPEDDPLSILAMQMLDVPVQPPPLNYQVVQYAAQMPEFRNRYNAIRARMDNFERAMRAAEEATDDEDLKIIFRQMQE